MENVKMRLHHVGVAVYSFDASVPFYEAQGYIKQIEIYDPEQNVEVCVLRHPQSPCIELLAPHDEKSPINNILKKSGVSPYHICYEVENIETAFTFLMHLTIIRFVSSLRKKLV